VPYVVAISVDGLNPDALTELGRDRLPHFFALLEGGATTLNARTEVEQTETLPNHTGMLTGRPIEGPDGHGVRVNKDSGRGTVDSHAGREIDSVFDVVHASGGSTAMYATKTKFALFQRSWADSLDRVAIDEDNPRLVDRLVADLRDDPATFTFVHLSAPDVAGHDAGFMGSTYLSAVRQVDGFLGRIRTAMAASPKLGRGGYLVLTADHGGRGRSGHADPAKLDDYRIPFLVDGPRIPRADLYALNRDYRDPGTGRPSYAGPQPVRNADLAAVSTALLGLSPVPGSVFGSPSPLDVR
jgi:predicted AlkP superfamily pyrophosphatase or phosphodiesterase